MNSEPIKKGSGYKVTPAYYSVAQECYPANSRPSHLGYVFEVALENPV